MHDPMTTKFPYPECTDGHYLKVKMDRGIVFDSHYPYVNRSKWFLFVNFVFRVLLNTVVFPVARTRMGLKVEGRENLKKHKTVLADGIISCCNHVHMWDYISIMSAVVPYKPYILVWARNVNGENGTMIRHVGGIPIPEGHTGATLAYIKAVKKLLQNGNWLHIYSEGSMWEYYAPIRPFKTGAAYLAYETGKPVLPMAYTYRKPGWIRKHIFGQIACFTLHIGEPIYADTSLPKKEQIADLTKRSHEAVCRLAGIEPDANHYEPLFDDSRRVDYYSSTYGNNYKGSW